VSNISRDSSSSDAARASDIDPTSALIVKIVFDRAARSDRSSVAEPFFPLLISKRVRPILEKSYAMENAAEALRHLIEDRPFGRVVLSV